MRMLYKFGCLVLFLLFFSSFKPVNAQYHYSIDIEAKKSRRVPLKYAIVRLKETTKTSRELKKKKRNEIKSSKKIKKHTYSIQKYEVKKRMRKSAKKAEYYNKGKVPMVVKLKKIFNG